MQYSLAQRHYQKLNTYKEAEEGYLESPEEVLELVGFLDGIAQGGVIIRPQGLTIISSLSTQGICSFFANVYEWY